MYYHPLRIIHSLTDEVHAFITAADSCCQICGCFLLRLLRRLNRLQRKAPSVTMYPCVLNKPSVCCSATERERDVYQQQLALSVVHDEQMEKMERTKTCFWKSAQTDRIIPPSNARMEPRFTLSKMVLRLRRAKIKINQTNVRTSLFLLERSR